MNDAEAYLAIVGIGALSMDRMVKMGYFTQPASKGRHLACEGGLAQHSVNVTRRLVELTNVLHIRWSRDISPYVVGMLHDLVKCRCYRMKGHGADEGPTWEYVQPEHPGHGVCSVMIAAELGIGLYPDEIVAITYHMGAYGIGKEYTDKEMDAAMKLYAPQIIATHTADWYACHVDESEVRK